MAGLFVGICVRIYFKKIESKSFMVYSIHNRCLNSSFIEDVIKVCRIQQFL